MSRGCELFLGGLNKETRRSDLERIFAKYGRVTRCDIKYVNGYAGTAYGFIGYDDERDGDDAIKHENGRKICGKEIKIEKSKTKAWNKSAKPSSLSSRHRDDHSSYGYRRTNRSNSRDRFSRHPRHRSRTRSVSRSRSRSRRRSSRSRQDRSSRRDRSRSRTRSKSRSKSRERIKRSTSRNNDNKEINDNNDVKMSFENTDKPNDFESDLNDKSIENTDRQNDFESDLYESNSANEILINYNGDNQTKQDNSNENNDIENENKQENSNGNDEIEKSIVEDDEIDCKNENNATTDHMIEDKEDSNQLHNDQVPAQNE